MICELVGSNLHCNLQDVNEALQLVAVEDRGGLDFADIPREAKPLSAKLNGQDKKVSIDVVLSCVPKATDAQGIDVKFVPPEEKDWAKRKSMSIAISRRSWEQLVFGDQPLIAYYDGGNSQVRISYGRKPPGRYSY